MVHFALEGENKVPPEVLHGQGHGKAPVAADGNGLHALCVLEGFQNGSARVVLVGEKVALDLHARKAVHRVRMPGERLHIGGEALHEALVLPDLFGEMPEQIVLQTELLALMAGLHELQAGNVHIQVHLLFNSLVSGAQRLDLRIGKSSLIHILAGANRGF